MISRRLARSIWLTSVAILALAARPAPAQSGYMVADLGDQVHRDHEGTNFPMEVAELAGVGYYFHHDGIHGSELWRTDGSGLGTYLLRDICPGICGARDLWAYSNLAAAAGVLFFTANDGVHGNELWLTDGSALGTHMVRDVQPGWRSSSPAMFTVSGSQLFFLADDGSHGRELWRSDGTVAGTYLVADIQPGRPDSGAGPMVASQSLLFFSVTAWDAPRGLWVSDGTGPGTSRVSEVQTNYSSFYKGHPFVVLPNGTLLFNGTSGSSDSEPWVSDGTPGGTLRLLDLLPGPDGSSPSNFVVRGGEVVFTAETDGSNTSYELWRTDGTVSGTVPIAVPAGLELRVGGGLHGLAGNTLFFAGFQPATGLELWKLEGDVVSLVRDVRPGAESSIIALPGPFPGFDQALFAPVGGRLAFLADDGLSGLELWSSDGTEAGTIRVSEIRPGAETPIFDFYLQLVRPPVFGDRLLLREYDPVLGYRLWRSDGTITGTAMIELFGQSTSSFLDVHMPFLLFSLPGPFCAAAAGTRLVFETFSSPPEEILAWGTDGSESGTELLGIPPGPDGSFRLSCAALGNRALLLGGDETLSGLWRTDGRASGTAVISFLPAPGAGTSSTIPLFVPFGSELAFGVYGNVFRTTGEEGETFAVSPLEDFWPSVLSPSADGRLYFGGAELYVSEGAPETTSLVADLNGANSGAPTDLTPFGTTQLLFGSLDDALGEELWVTEGTPATTQLVLDIYPGSRSGFGRNLQDFAGEGPGVRMAGLGAVAVLAANDGMQGTELWVTDGTALGTGLLRDIYPGDYPSTPRQFTRLGSRIVFCAEDEEHGLELWVTDGTYPGTVLLKDVAPGTPSSVPDDLVVRDGVLYFSAWSPNYGREAWKSDGTTAGTVRISDVALGPLSSSPQRFARAGNRLYFSATDQVHGYELWALSDDGTIPLFLDGFESSDTDRWSEAIP